MSKITLPNQWEARNYQRGLFRAILVEGKKRAACVWHRRGGKDSCSINLLAVLSQLRVGTYWHCLPTFQQGRRVIWDGIDKKGRNIVDQAFPAELVESKNSTNMQVFLKNGSIYQVVGSDNIDTLVGTNPIGVIFSEFAIGSPLTWDFVRPILAENDGIAIFIFTPRGKNHGYTLYEAAKNNPRWYTSLLTVEDTHAISMEAIDEEIESGMTPELVKQEFWCSFEAAVTGSFYGDLISDLREQNRLCDFEINPMMVSTHWDLGISDSTAVWFWRYDNKGEPEIIDYYEAHGKSIDHYMDVLEEKGYFYERHWLPHDARARSLATGMSIFEQMKNAGLPVSIAPKMSVMDGIQAVRYILQRPIKFHKTKCKRGIDALEAYRRDYDEEKKVFSQHPLHDWSSHGADAFRYLALTMKAARNIMKARQAEEAQPKSTILTPTLDEMWAMREKSNGLRKRI